MPPLEELRISATPPRPSELRQADEPEEAAPDDSGLEEALPTSLGEADEEALNNTLGEALATSEVGETNEVAPEDLPFETADSSEAADAAPGNTWLEEALVAAELLLEDAIPNIAALEEVAADDS